ncbi:tetratricopeptide repeat protein [Ferroplasma acidarmanus]|nr:tetratricopeptide repeat protein [Ferroplasma acidarmanus]
MPNKSIQPAASKNMEKAIGLMENYDYSDAKKRIDMALALDPLNYEYHYIKVNLLIERRDYEGALKELHVMEKLVPDKASVYSLESRCLINLGKNFDAVGKADEALEHDRNYMQAYENKLIALQNIGLINDAFDVYYSALKVDPQDAESYAVLSELHMEMKNFDAAHESAKKAINIEKDNIKANNMLVSIARVDGGIEDYIKALSDAYVNTHYEGYIVQLTNCLYESGNREDAVKIAEKFYKINPGNMNFAHNLAHIFILENRIQDAGKVYKNSIKLNKSEFTNLQYITFLNETEQYAAVLKNVDELIARYPDNDGFLYNKFYALSRGGDHKDALIIIKLLYGQNKDSILYKVEYALELALTGNSDESLRILENFEELYIDPWISMSLWSLYSMLNQYDRANEYAILAMENGIGDEFLGSFPLEVIETYLEKGWKIQAIKFIDALIERAEGELQDICIACKGCILGIDDYDKGRDILEQIGSAEKIRYLLLFKLKFTDVEINNFINRYKNEKL